MTAPQQVTGQRAGPTHVGVNLLWLGPGVVGGSEEYTTRLLRALLQAAPEDLTFTLFVLEPFVEAHPDLTDGFPTVVLDLDGRQKPRRVAAEATWLAMAARRHRGDLLHHAGGVIPPGPGIGHWPSVLTIHDLQPLLVPENFSPAKRRWIATMLPRSARRAQHVVTPSDPASQSVVEHLGVTEDRVSTVPHGIAPPEPVGDHDVRAVRQRYRLEGQVILYPAITYPHKDHCVLIDAFASLASDRKDVTLVLTGGAGPNEAAVAAAIGRSGVGDQVRRTGRVPWSDLRALYAAATLVAVPSRFEGFGAPALEAMATGCPLVAADATALPWVVEDGGVLVAPGDVEGWASAMVHILDDPEERARLGVAGRRRASWFTAERSSDALVAAYRLAIGRSG